jgi:hypothetical protein
LLIRRCLESIATRHTDFVRSSFAAAELLAESFPGNEQVSAKLLEAFASNRSGDWFFPRPELAVALAIGWPRSPHVQQLYVQMLREGDSVHEDYAAYFEITLSQCPADQFPLRLQRHLAASGVVSNRYVSRALLGAVARRLRRDSDARGALLMALTESSQPTNKASFARCLAIADGLSEQLAGYCSREIHHQIEVENPEIGYDVISGELRGILLSLLDVLDGPTTGFHLEDAPYD